MKRVVTLLVVAFAVALVGCKKAEDPTVALDKSIMAVHDSVMVLDGYLTQLGGLLTTEAGKVDTNLKKADEKSAAIAKMAVFQKEAKALGDAQVAMQEWMKAFATKPAAEKPVEERLTWFKDQLTAVQNVASLYGTGIASATKVLSEVGVEVPAAPKPEPKPADEGGEGEGHK